MDAQFKVACDHQVGSPVLGYKLALCPRCLGTGFYNALSYGPDGKVIVVQGGSKLVQQIIKILTEDKRPSGYGFDYSVLSNVVGPSTVMAVKSEVVRCITYLKDSQFQSEQAGYVYLPSERIVQISDLFADTDSTDPRKVIVSVSVLTQSGNVNVQIPLRR